MRTTIDGAGRIVVPKPLRDELGVQPGQVLELQVRDGHLQVDIVPVEMRLERSLRSLMQADRSDVGAVWATDRT